MCCLSTCWCQEESIKSGAVLNDRKRRCTDRFFLMIFLLFSFGLIIIPWYAVENGDPYRILYGSDSFGNTCGRENDPIWIHSNNSEQRTKFALSGQDMSNRRYLFPLNITRKLEIIWTCVHKCPDTMVLTHSDIRNIAVEKNNTLCADYQTALNIENITNTFGLCPRLPVMKSIPIIYRCLPLDILTFGHDVFEKVIEIDVIRGFLYDIITVFPIILKMSFISLALSLIAIVLLQFFVVMIIYTIYIMVVVFAAGISSGLWYCVYTVYANSYMDAKNMTSMGTLNEQIDIVQPAQAQIAAVFNEINVESWFKLEKVGDLTLLGIALGATVLTASISTIVWCLFPRIKNVIKLFRCASKALSAMPLLLLQPAVTALCVAIVGIYSLSIGLVLYTTGDMVTKRISDGGDRTINIIDMNITETTKMMMLYQLVGFIWISEFLMACQRLFVAGAVSLYYFNSLAISNRYTSKLRRSPIRSSLWNLLRYHLGSAAFGSFVITLVRLPRYILMWIFAKIKAVENPVLRKLLASLICILGCIENCFRYINHNVFTVISYSGLSFFPAAKIAVNHLLNNVIDVATVNTVGDSVLFLTKCIIAATTMCISLIDMQRLPALFHPWFPLAIIFIISYQIANCFLSVYEMTVDTIMLCSAEESALMRENPETSQEYRECMHDNCDENMRILSHTDQSESSQPQE